MGRLVALPSGEEPLPTGSITECVILRRDGISVVALEDGTVDAGVHTSTGVYYRDTRYCSTLRFTVAGTKAVPLDRAESGGVHSVVFTNPALGDPNGLPVPPRSILITQRRVVDEGVHQALIVSNYSGAERVVDIEIEYDADFRDIFEVRGWSRPGGEMPPVTWRRGTAEARAACVGLDGVERTVRFSFAPQPDVLSEHSALFTLAIPAGGSIGIEVSIEPEEIGEPRPFVERIERVRVRHEEWLSSLASIETDNDVFNGALQQALLDINALRMSVDGESFIAAGVPWFDTLFGRDSLLTGMMLAPYSPEMLGGVLQVLANHQAQEMNARSDARPGKIPHELRWGELARAGLVPFGEYYGSVDSTPLFLMAAAEYYRWSGDRAGIEALTGNIERALAWCENEIDERGLLSYARGTEAGLENQGWKDSVEATIWPDGRPVRHPIALVEVQGYAYAAGRACEELGDILGDEIAERGRQLAARANDALTSHFIHDRLGYVFCIDGDGAAVPSVTSNPGHLLWAGAASAGRAGTVAARLLADDMFSGWGVRTLSSENPMFNPLGYHTGSVWPHENAMIVLGLRRYGFDAEAMRLATALIEAALAFPGSRLPELFSGSSRESRHVPTPYPVASRPQAWSSAVLPSLLPALLGITPGSPNELYIVRPTLPASLGIVKVRNIRFGANTANLVFVRHGERATVEVESLSGDGRVVLSNEWPGSRPSPQRSVPLSLLRGRGGGEA